MRMGEFVAAQGPAPRQVREDAVSASEIFVTQKQLPLYGICYSKAHLPRLVKAGVFPQPVALSPNRRAWRLSDLLAWKASRRPIPGAERAPLIEDARS